MKHITLEQAKELKVGTILYHLQNKNADDSPQRWKVNGKVKLWKRHPEKVQVPMKHGLRQGDYLTQDDLDMVSLTPYWQRKFVFLSDADYFQRKKQKEGFRTQKEFYGGIGTPYTLIMWEPKTEKVSDYQKLKERHPNWNWTEADAIADDDLIAAADYYDELK